MQARTDVQLLGELARYGLRFTCRDCEYYLPESAGCAHEWPNAQHRELPVLGEMVTFCKEFELA